MIEFTAQAKIDFVESVLVEVGSSGSFSVKPDRFIKSTSNYKKYVLFLNSSEQESAFECGTVEICSKKGSQVSIKISASSQYSNDPSGSKPLELDRFFYLLTQRLLQAKMVTVETNK